MASLIKDPNGSVRIEFTGVDGRRKKLTVGKVNARTAGDYRRHVEALISAKVASVSPDRETMAWLGGLTPKMRKRIAATGIVNLEEQAAARVVTLDELMAEWLAAAQVKQSTLTAYAQTQRLLVEHFGGERPVRGIAALDAEKWRQWLVTEKDLAPATVAKRVRVARQAFRAAVRWKMVAESPFAEVRGGSMTNNERQHFVTRADYAKLLEWCHTGGWRVRLALCRIGGLRCPSETEALRWSDVDWTRHRFRVTSGKTKRYAGKGDRWVPLFPELRDELEAFRRSPEADPVFVTGRERPGDAAIYNQLERIVKRAKLTAWPRLRHNLRGSRETELAKEWPLHVVCAWIGNSEKVARDHYLQTTDADFMAASGVTPEVTPPSDRTPETPEKTRDVMASEGLKGHHANAGTQSANPQNQTAYVSRAVKHDSGLPSFADARHATGYATLNRSARRRQRRLAGLARAFNRAVSRTSPAVAGSEGGRDA